MAHALFCSYAVLYQEACMAMSVTSTINASLRPLAHHMMQQLAEGLRTAMTDSGASSLSVQPVRTQVVVQPQQLSCQGCTLRSLWPEQERCVFLKKDLWCSGAGLALARSRRRQAGNPQETSPHVCWPPLRHEVAVRHMRQVHLGL
eukprot:scaffold98294_cov42-Prasinocladus_malaysianus.AAC.1